MGIHAAVPGNYSCGVVLIGQDQQVEAPIDTLLPTHTCRQQDRSYRDRNARCTRRPHAPDDTVGGEKISFSRVRPSLSVERLIFNTVAFKNDTLSLPEPPSFPSPWIF